MSLARIAFLAVLLSTVLLVAPSAASGHTETVDGVAVPLPEEDRVELEDSIADLKANYPGPDPHIWLIQADSTTYLVVSSEPVQIGEVTVTGSVSSDGEIATVFAESVSFDTTPTEVDGQAFTDNPEAYTGQYITTTITTSQLSYAYDTANGQIREPKLIGSIPPSDRASPAQQAQRLTINRSEGGIQFTSQSGLVSALGQAAHVSFRNGYSMPSTETRLTGVVLPRPPGAIPENNTTPVVYTTQTEPVAQSVSVADVLESPAAYEEQVIEIEADAFGATGSSKRILTRTSPCDGSETVGFPPVCVPAVTDSQLHGGVVTHPDATGEFLPYAGVSNHNQGTAVRPVAGDYTLTVRVVKGDRIHPALDGYALELYGRERNGPPRLAGEARQSAETAGSDVFGALETQLTTSWSEQENYADNATIDNENLNSQSPEPAILITDVSVNTTTSLPGGGIALSGTLINDGAEGETQLDVTFHDGAVYSSRQISVSEGEQRFSFTFRAQDRSSGGIRMYLDGEHVIRRAELGFIEYRTPTAAATSQPADTESASGDGGESPREISFLRIGLGVGLVSGWVAILLGLVGIPRRHG